MLRTADAVAENPWKFCLICEDKFIFRNTDEFRSHLRQFHCTKEGGSFVCHYGKHGVCQSLPLEGVNSRDYENHVEKVHIFLDGKDHYRRGYFDIFRTRLEAEGSLRGPALFKFLKSKPQ